MRVLIFCWIILFAVRVVLYSYSLLKQKNLLGAVASVCLAVGSVLCCVRVAA